VTIIILMSLNESYEYIE